MLTKEELKYVAELITHGTTIPHPSWNLKLQKAGCVRLSAEVELLRRYIIEELVYNDKKESPKEGTSV